jgi:hypothetical protein
LIFHLLFNSLFLIINFSLDRNNRNKGFNMKFLNIPTSAALANPKLLVIRFNRLLGWALLASPPVQIMLGTGFWRGLAWDVAILLVHGLISLALFGKPHSESFRTQPRLQLFFGGSRDALHRRDRLLMDAWRILISLLRFGLFVFLAYWVAMFGYAGAALDSLAWNIVMLVSVVLIFPVFSGLLFFQLLFTASVLRHVRDATAYAYRRWGLTQSEAGMLGWLTMGCFVMLSFMNLIKGIA